VLNLRPQLVFSEKNVDFVIAALDQVLERVAPTAPQ
jgi:hypothetical protein